MDSFAFQGDIWKFLQMFLVVIMQKGPCCYWHFAEGYRVATKHHAMPGTASSIRNYSAVSVISASTEIPWPECYTSIFFISFFPFFNFFFYTNGLSVSPIIYNLLFFTQQCLGYFSILRCTIYLIILNCWRDSLYHKIFNQLSKGDNWVVFHFLHHKETCQEGFERERETVQRAGFSMVL